MKKTEVMLFTPKYNSQFVDKVSVQVGNARKTPTICERNLGVMFDSNMTMTQEVASICRSGYPQLRYLSKDTTKSLVHGLGLGNCNALIHVLLDTMIRKFIEHGSLPCD